MGAADDIKQGLTKNLASFTKQRKAEEKQSSAMRYRTARVTEVRGMYQTEAANQVMEECYMKVSDNNQLPANARQIFYVARPLIEGMTDRPLGYNYFSQTLLPDYIENYGKSDWDVVYDDRGHFKEPHTNRIIGLGTLNVRAYLKSKHKLQIDPAGFSVADISTYGPHGCYSAVLYIEKEGFMPLFKRVRLAERYDIAIMSAKGISVTAARELAEMLGVPFLVLHDFDRPGIIIFDTLAFDTRRYVYKTQPTVIDLGLKLEDVGDLTPEEYTSNISDERLREAGANQETIEFLKHQRVELNAMTSRQLVTFVESKLDAMGITKVIPDKHIIEDTYRHYADSDRLSDIWDEVGDEERDSVTVPDDLEAKIKDRLEKYPTMTWHRAIRLEIDPDAPDDEDDEKDHGEDEDDDDEDEDLGDIDE
jgi:hypothetical protein